MKMIKKTAFILVGAAFFLLPAFCKAAADYAPGAAVITGIIFAVTIGNPFEKLTGKYTSFLLGAAIVGMGCAMDLIAVLKAGANGFIYTFIGIAAGLWLGVFFGKKLKLERNVMYLISVGTSICGGSAIASAAPALKAKAHDIAIAGATVFTLNAVALLIFPVIGRALNMDEIQFGYWAALAIHDTSSVVGATLQYGSTALEVGTTVKLARALWIVPVTLFLSCFVGAAGEDEKKSIKLKVSWFIPGFIIAAAIYTFLPEHLPFVADVGKFLKSVSKNLMVLTLFFIGANLSKDKLRELGFKPVIHGIILWLILSSVWCAAIVTGVVKCAK
ncbi:MAG: putative sulfate exporter family transporter [Lentisphaeria bacterium]|nr:putative sulfate exporter family transporter [Lentisphaeria bacterium]